MFDAVLLAVILTGLNSLYDFMYDYIKSTQHLQTAEHYLANGFMLAVSIRIVNYICDYRRKKYFEKQNGIS